jgi:hypothetical protein
MCPYYMSIGMTYDEFWNQDVTMVRAFRKSYELKRRQQNETLWMQGLYIRDALLSTVGNMFSSKSDAPIEYPKEPYPVTAEQIAEKKEAEQRRMEERIKADFAALAARMMKQQMPLEAHPYEKGGENNEYNH